MAATPHAYNATVERRMAGAHRDGGRGRPLGLEPGAPLEGRIRLAGSKSLAQRHLVLASLASGRTTIAGLSEAADVRDARALVLASGAEVASAANASTVTVTGRPLGSGGGGWAGTTPLDAGESGTLARFATVAAALCATVGAPRVVTGRGTLLDRTSAPLFAALNDAGASCEHVATAAGWPVAVGAARAPAQLVLRAPVSSQEASALLVAAAAQPRATSLRVIGRLPSEPYFEMTIAVLERYGARLERRSRPDGFEVLSRGPLGAPAEIVQVEPDASSAAVALVAACISGGRVTALGLGPDSLQGDMRIADHLAAFGCRAWWEHGDLVAGGRPTRSAEIDLVGEPDLAPPLAALAVARALVAPPAETPSVLRGLGALAGKESPRVEVLAGLLERLGVLADAGPEHLAIGPGRAGDGALVLETASDHRIAFFAALVGLARGGVRLADASVVAKSWPRFFDDLERLGAGVVREPDDGSGPAASTIGAP